MSTSRKRKRSSRTTASQQDAKLTKRQRRELKRQEEEQQKQLAEMVKKRMTKRVMLWSGVLSGLILAVLGLIYLTNSPEPEPTTQLVNPIPTSGWTLGNPTAPITLVEYSDFQCDSCARYHHIMKRLVEELGKDFQFIFRHYPLRNHANAKLAARSAEAAGRQGKFWEMQDLLFVQQKELAKKGKVDVENALVQYATLLGLDVARFQRDLYSQEVIRKVNDDYQEGRDAGVTGTPTFFLNGRKIAGNQKPQNYKAFKAFIQGEGSRQK